MITGQWYLGLVIGALAVNAVLAYQAYRLHRGHPDAGSGAPAGRSDLVDRDEGVVECPDCGAENELGYRYCRACVTELPVSMTFRSRGDLPLGRLSP